MQYDSKLNFRFLHVYDIQATTAIADFRGLTVFSAIYVVYCR